MVYEFKFPDVGEGITEGRLVKWLVKVNDEIKEDQPLLEVETDKAVVEIPSPITGKVSELLFKEGDTLNLGEVILRFDSNDKPVSDSLSRQVAEGIDKEEEPKKQEAIEVKQENKKVETTSNILALPMIRKLAKDKGIDLSKIKGSGKHGEIVLNDLNSASSETKIEDVKDITKTSNEILATPSTRKLARELGVDITKIKGSGRNGMILKEDLEKKESLETIASKAQVETKNLDFIDYTGIRKIIGDRMTQSIHTNAQVTVFDDFDLTKINNLRKNYEKLSYLPFICKATILALKKHPILNSKLLDEKIIIEKNYNLGIAVDTTYGLVVPVIKNADKLNVLEIKELISNLAIKAKDKKLLPDEMKNSTFTISGIGSIGVKGFTPIINSPESAILGVGRVDDCAVVLNKEIVIRKIAVFSLSFDHRVLDGAEAARFMNTLKNYVENPEKMMVEL